MLTHQAPSMAEPSDYPQVSLQQGRPRQVSLLGPVSLSVKPKGWAWSMVSRLEHGAVKGQVGDEATGLIPNVFFS